MFLSVLSLQTAGRGGDGAIEEAGVWAAIWHMSTKGLSQIIGRHRQWLLRQSGPQHSVST